LDSGDATNIQKAIVHIPVANIPAVPTGLTPVTNALDPRLFVPQDFIGGPGNTVTVPIQLQVTAPTGITVGRAEVALSYDPNKFLVSNTRVGSLLAGFTAAFDSSTPGLVLFSAWSNTGT